MRAALLGLARHRLLYPALRSRPATLRAPTQLLVELGFAADDIAAADRDYERAAAELFPQLLERARAVGSVEQTDKLAQPGLPAHESKRLAYVATRVTRPRVVVETGTFSGGLSTFLLRALADNGGGRLVSLDIPAYEPIEDAIHYPLPLGQEPGWLIPEELGDRLDLVLGDARRTLPPALERAGGIGLFVHDSLHTVRHMLFEYRHAWRHLEPGGLLLSDDVFRNPAFWLFATVHRLPFRHIGNVGALRKQP